MSVDSEDLFSSRPLRTLTELDVVEAFARSGSRGEIAVLDRFTPYMLQGALTKEALFQLAFHVEDSYVNADRGLLYSAILLQAATLVLKGDSAAWAELRTRPGKLGEFIGRLVGPESAVIEHDRRLKLDTVAIHARGSVPTAVHDLLDIVLTRLHFDFEALSYLHDHLQDGAMKRLVKMLLLMKGNERVPGNA